MNNLVVRLEKIYSWLLIAPAILPIVIWGGFIYPYLVPKTLLFYALSLVSVALFLILVTYGRSFFWSRLIRWEAWTPAALLVVAYGTSIVGTDFYRSFWSLLIRGDGLLMLTCVVSSFYLILLSADRIFLNRLSRSVALVASSVALYGIYEWIVDGGRIGSLLGNAAFFAGYLGIAFFVTLVAAQSLSGGWRHAALLGAILQIVAIVLSATRGSMLALGISLVSFLVYKTFRKPEQEQEKNEVRLGLAARSAPFFSCSCFGFFSNKGRTISLTLLVTLLVLAGAFFTFRTQLAYSTFSPIARVASVSTDESDVASRLFIWENMLTEIMKRPLLGVGAEHIDSLFNNFYDPTLIYEQWFDRSHNAFLDYAAQYGIFGLLLYIALICTFLTTAVKRLRTGDTKTAELLALLAVTYSVQNFFVFDTISSFWLTMALLAVFVATSGTSARETIKLPQSIRPVSLAIAVMLLIFIIPVSVYPALAAYDLREAYKYQIVDVSKEVEYLSHGVALSTYADVEYGYQVYDMYANNQATNLKGQDRTIAYQVAVSILTSNFYKYQYDARTALYLASVLTLAPEGSPVDSELLYSATERAIKLSPKRAQPWFILTNLYIGNANKYPPFSKERVAGYLDARNILSDYIELVPKLSTPHYVLAELLRASGDEKESMVEAEKGRVYYKSGDLDTARRAVSYYENRLDLKNARFFLEEILKEEPNNVGARSDLDKINSYERSGK